MTNVLILWICDQTEICFFPCFQKWHQSVKNKDTLSDNVTPSMGPTGLRLGTAVFDFINEMNRALGHFCAHTGWTGPGEPPEAGEMSEMTPPCRHRIWNSNREVWGRALYLSVTETPHNTEFYKWMGKKHFRFLQTAGHANLRPKLACRYQFQTLWNIQRSCNKSNGCVGVDDRVLAEA